MSEIRRVALHSAPRGRKEKGSPARSVRLNIELTASNEDHYPEISYRELVTAQLKEKEKANGENGKKSGLDPFSDGEDDVARIAQQFEKKYGAGSSYGKPGKSKRKTSIDEFADIGAGYDENDSFIDNTDGYDEMCPPGYDTFHSGFYINCGSLEFKNVAEEDSEPHPTGRNNKRRISSSSESSSSSDSSESESSDKERALNGDDQRKSKKKTEGKIKSKKMRTEASSAATSGKHTSDDRSHSADSRTSHTEDSLTSKPAPSSENVATSDSSRDIAEPGKTEVKLPPLVSTVLEELAARVAKLKQENIAKKDMGPHTDPYVLRLERALGACSSDTRIRRSAWSMAARTLSVSRPALLQRARDLDANSSHNSCKEKPPSPDRLPETKPKEAPEPMDTTPAASTSRPQPDCSKPPSNPSDSKLLPESSKLPSDSSKSPSDIKLPPDPHKPSTISSKLPTTSKPSAISKPITSKSTEKISTKKKSISAVDTEDGLELSPEDKEKQIAIILERLKALVEEAKPNMILTYKVECDRIHEENKKIAAANAAAADSAHRLTERRLPKRRYPWCGRIRQLLVSLVRLCSTRDGDSEEAAARLMAHRVLPLFPPGFVRLPTLLRQANLNKDIKVPKTQQVNMPIVQSVTQPLPPHKPSQTTHAAAHKPQQTSQSVIQTAHKPPDKPKESSKAELKLNGQLTKPEPVPRTTFNSIFSAFSLAGTDVFLDKPKTEKQDKSKANSLIIEKIERSPEKPKELEIYIPPNNIGSITITPVAQVQKSDPRHQASKLANNTVTVSAKSPVAESRIRVKSPAEIMKAANAMTKDEKPKTKVKLPETKKPADQKPKATVLANPIQIQPMSNHPLKPQENRSISPLRIDTAPSNSVIKTHSPNFRQVNGGTKDRDIPRPALVPKTHSPTFAKPAEKKKEADTFTDVYQVDDSSSDVELIEETSSKAQDPLSVPDAKKEDKLRQQRLSNDKSRKREHESDRIGPNEKSHKSENRNGSEKKDSIKDVNHKSSLRNERSENSGKNQQYQKTSSQSDTRHHADSSRNDKPSGHSDSGKPSHHSDKPSHHRDKPSHLIDKPSHQGENPDQNSDKTSHHSGKPSHLSDKPSHQGDKPGHLSDKPSHHSDKPTHQADKPSHQSDKTSHHCGKPNHHTDKPSHHSDKQMPHTKDHLVGQKDFQKLQERRLERQDELSDSEFERVMKNLQDLRNSQEPHHDSYGNSLNG